jgi:hypothetical protein
MPDEVTLDMEVDSDDEATDDLLDELFQLAQLTEQMCQQHQEALFIMNRIKEQLDQKDKLYVTGENHTKRDLDTALEELHTNAMQHIDQTGTSNFSESLLTMLSTCTF